MMAFPWLFALETNKDAFVKDRISILGDFLWQWRRDPRVGREAEQLYRSEKKVDAIYLPCQDLPTSWNNLLPQKVRLLRNKVFTKCNLDARGIDLHSTLCGCMNAKMLWLEVLDWWMLYVTLTQSVNELPLIWNSSSLGVAQQELSFGVRSAQNHLFRLGSLGF
ncbi:hypothetical protein Tco_0466298 [Tanacetum coccineum]